MAEGGFSLRQLADIYAGTWVEQCKNLGSPEYADVGSKAIYSFVEFVERLQGDSK